MIPATNTKPLSMHNKYRSFDDKVCSSFVILSNEGSFQPPPTGSSSLADALRCYNASNWLPAQKIHFPTEGELFAPSLADTFRQPSPRHTFIPLFQNDPSTFGREQKLTHAGWNVHETPPASPTDMKKDSSALSVHTTTTVDSTESLQTSFASIGSMSPFSSPLASKSQVPFIPLSTTSHKDVTGSDISSSSLQRALWLPSPRPTTPYCRATGSPAGTLYTKSQATTSSVGRKNLYSPTREDQDPVRKSKVKTELCVHFINKTQCPFGANCTYAHGEDELKLTKLIDLHEAGLVDAGTYRTVPCLTFVSTGSCPFGKRCHGIHDPRAAGSKQSWLPHTETQGNTIATDINVDALHQKRLYSILYNNPFGAIFNPETDSFVDLYKLVTNTKGDTSFRPIVDGKRVKCTNVMEHHKLSMALQMRGSSNFQFKFRPQHIIYDELCMVLQKRAFRLTRDEALEIPLSTYDTRSSMDILVREIAFGPDCDPTVRGVSLWFGISESDVTLCTPQQAKRYRWKRGPSKKSKDEEVSRLHASHFDNLESFPMIRPSERDAYGLSTAMLDHRLAVLKAKLIPDMCERVMAMERLEVSKVSLVEYFDGLLNSWKTWRWQANQGRTTVDTSTPVPPVDGEYNASTEDNSDMSTVGKIWQSFASGSFRDEATKEDFEDFILPTRADLAAEDSRLACFRLLSEGASLVNSCEADCVSLPHIRENSDGFFEIGSVTSQSRKCWRSLLLRREKTQDEWSVVLAHFSQSRSRKVLTILQQ